MKTLRAIGIILIVMFGCPWAAVTLLPGDAGMAVMLVLLFGVNSMESLYVGVFSGMAVKSRWYLPVVNAAAFMISTWIIFDWGNPDFQGYAIAYLALSVLTMLITIAVVRNVRKKQNNG